MDLVPLGIVLTAACRETVTAGVMMQYNNKRDCGLSYFIMFWKFPDDGL
jgi:hypothetical protein